MRKATIIIHIISAGLLVFSAIYWIKKEPEPLEPTVVEIDKETNNVLYFEDGSPSANSLIVGKWQSTSNQQWYKMYLDDYDGDGYFWGKEWDEQDDVKEEDLSYHGNGWFRWKIEDNELIELSSMDSRDVPIPKQYDIIKLREDTLTIREVYSKKSYNFAKW